MHQSVLLNEFLSLDRCAGGEPSFWDGTLGAAGHTIAWLKKNPEGKSFGSDQDADMLQIARQNLESAGLIERVTLRHQNYSRNPFIDFAPFDTILLDLGISSFHLDSLGRGISFRDNALLDMRMDISEGIPLHEWLRGASLEEIREIIFSYGEESHGNLIARKIVEQRDATRELTASWLNDICIQAYSRGGGKYVKNPGVKTFQAFRIFINRELDHLRLSLEFLPGLLKVGGRLMIISFHSLEDRIVKQTFRGLEQIKNTSPEAKSEYSPGNFKSVTKKAIMPGEAEIDQNPRARSARMRVLERLR